MNAFKRSIAARRRQIGLWQALASPYAAELCAGAGFDWLLIDGEHAPNDLPLVLAQLQSMAAYPVEPVVRPPVGDPVLIKQLLDFGARTLLIPMVDTVEQAQAMVRATRYPPAGTRGVGAAIGRASRWNRVPAYLTTAAEDICLLLQIESLSGLEHLAAIAALDGVDGLFIGPSDLAASLGHLGRPDHPHVQEVMENAVRSIVSSGKAAGILMTDEMLARRYIEIGVTFIAVSSDVTILARGAEELAQRFGGGVQSDAPGVY